MDSLIIENLSKSFGSNRIIDSISFSVPQGSIFGLLGENGAGKTTTMKMITGLSKFAEKKFITEKPKRTDL